MPSWLEADDVCPGETRPSPQHRRDGERATATRQNDDDSDSDSEGCSGLASPATAGATSSAQASLDSTTAATAAAGALQSKMNPSRLRGSIIPSTSSPSPHAVAAAAAAAGASAGPPLPGIHLGRATAVPEAVSPGPTSGRRAVRGAVEVDVCAGANALSASPCVVLRSPRGGAGGAAVASNVRGGNQCREESARGALPDALASFQQQQRSPIPRGDDNDAVATSLARLAARVVAPSGAAASPPHDDFYYPHSDAVDALVEGRAVGHTSPSPPHQHQRSPGSTSLGSGT